MRKETIKLKDIATNAKYPEDKNLHPDDWDTVRVIQETKKSFDGEKGFIDIELVFKRLSDGKLFKFEYTNFGQGQNDILDQTATEVEEKSKILKYYE